MTKAHGVGAARTIQTFSASSDLFTGFSDKGSEGLPVHSAASLKLPTLRDAPLARKVAKHGGEVGFAMRTPT